PHRRAAGLARLAAAPAAAGRGRRPRVDPVGLGGRCVAGDRRRRHGEYDAARRARHPFWAPSGTMAFAASERPRILILRRDNIGDLVCTTPLIEALRARHPQAWIGALVNTY